MNSENQLQHDRWGCFSHLTFRSVGQGWRHLAMTLLMLALLSPGLAALASTLPEEIASSIVWRLKHPTRIPAEKSSNGVATGIVPITHGRWYEVAIEYSPELIEDVENPSLLLIEVEFMSQGKRLDGYAYVPGLRVGAAGRLYRYVATESAFLEETDAPEKFRFAFRAPEEANAVMLRVLPWKNSADVALLNMSIAGISPIGGVAPEAVRRLAEPPSENHFELKIPAATLLDTTPIWTSTPVSGFSQATLTGKVITEKSSERNQALVRVRFLDANGNLIPGLYPGTTQSDQVGPYIYMASQEVDNCYSMEIPIPLSATELRLGFQSWGNAKSVALKEAPTLQLSRPQNLMAHLRAAGVATVDGRPPHGWLIEDTLVGRWLSYWLSTGDVVNTPSDLIAWLNPGREVELIPPANHGVLVSEGFYKALTDGVLKLSGFGPYRISLPPDWSDDPFGSKSWRQRYQSLYWVPEFAAVLTESGAEQQVNAIFDSWFAKNSWPWSQDSFAWDDHTIAMRVEGLVNLIHGRRAKPESMTFTSAIPVLETQLPRSLDQRLRIASQLIVDGLLLEELLDSRSFYAHNHALFHVNALLSISSAFPEMPGANRWRRKALVRLNELIDELWTKEGVSVEQSSAYQVWVLMTAMPVYMSLLQSDALSDKQKELFRQRLERALIVAISLLDPTGGYVRIGDSPVYDKAKEELLFLVRDFLPYISGPELKEFARAGDPPSGAHVFEGGYAVFRSKHPEERTLVVDISPQVFSHGHYDLGGFSYTTGDHSWVIDAGGPFNYGSLKQRQLASYASHNIAWPVGAGQADGYAVIEPLIIEDDYWVFVLRTNVYGKGCQHRRVFVVARDLTAVVILDEFDFQSKLPSLVSSLTLAPEVEVDDKQDHFTILANGEERLIVQKLPSLIDGSMAVESAVITPAVGELADTQRLSFLQQRHQKHRANIGYVFGLNEDALRKALVRLSQLESQSGE